MRNSRFFPLQRKYILQRSAGLSLSSLFSSVPWPPHLSSHSSSVSFSRLICCYKRIQNQKLVKGGPIFSEQSTSKFQLFSHKISNYMQRSSLSVKSHQSQDNDHQDPEESGQQEQLEMPTSSAESKKSDIAPLPKKKTRRTFKSLIAPIKLTDRAVERIKELIDTKPDEEKSNIAGIRIGVKRRGCNGLSYTMNYVKTDDIPQKDELVEKNGVKVWVDPLATMHIVGTEMDYEETELASEFTFNNPNAKGECGCGESFNT